MPAKSNFVKLWPPNNRWLPVSLSLSLSLSLSMSLSLSLSACLCDISGTRMHIYIYIYIYISIYDYIRIYFRTNWWRPYPKIWSLMQQLNRACRICQCAATVADGLQAGAIFKVSCGHPSRSSMHFRSSLETIQGLVVSAELLKLERVRRPSSPLLPSNRHLRHLRNPRRIRHLRHLLQSIPILPASRHPGTRPSDPGLQNLKS